VSPPTAITDAETRYAFGKNWEEFIEKYFSEERVRVSRRQMLDFLELPSLEGRYFLDIGCGSGLSSLAAWEAGAARVVSFDVDPDSVRTTERVRQLRGAPANWTVLEGSVLDRDFLAKLEPADIVYSWGVLHHTGRMWEAVANAAGCLKAGALFYIALYLTTPKSGYWLEVKRRYNRAPAWRKRLMEWRYILRHTILPRLVRGQNPIRHIRTYQSRRGMAFLTDVKDWLGGYPYEDATIQEVLRFCHRRLGLNLININPSGGMVEYLFHKPAGS
jgi:2-polyprenyl-6-hydroxyphenyl methylase/3-demethylubiquinone-9 3-methyltransferase